MSVSLAFFEEDFSRNGAAAQRDCLAFQVSRRAVAPLREKSFSA
jgi:hypothetical protein